MSLSHPQAVNPAVQAQAQAEAAAVAAETEYAEILARLRALKQQGGGAEELREVGRSLGAAKERVSRTRYKHRPRAPRVSVAGARRRAMAREAEEAAEAEELPGRGGAAKGAARKRAAVRFTLCLHRWTDTAWAPGAKVHVRHVASQEAERVPPYRALAASLATAAGGDNDRGRGGVLVLAVPDTDSLRTLACLLVRAGDHVLEIGCSYGACSRAVVEGGVGAPARLLGVGGRCVSTPSFLCGHETR
jgi:hypothetical protein